jgi:2-methylcitrate dehydratase
VDRTLAELVGYATSFGVEELTPEVRQATLNRLVDTVSVAIAGVDSEPARIAARLARPVSEGGATVFGFGHQASPELAAFANTVMVRTYDWNDGMQARGGGHPSDMVPGVLALAELAGSSGLDLLVSIALAYELLGGLGSDVPIGDMGFDQGTFMGVAVALAGGRLYGLDADQLAHAASLALTPNLPLGVSRWGSLSMMKGSATAFAIRSGVFAVQLAREGFTSASDPFEGVYGLRHAVGDFRPRLPVLPDGPRVVQMSHQKPVPAETQALCLLDLVPEIRAWAHPEEISSLEIEVSKHVADHICDPAKFDPRTRETADHSLPYMLAVALTDGEITLDSYRPERFLDPALRPLMARMHISVNDEFTAQRERELYGVTRPSPARITVRADDGRELVRRVNYYKGHPRDPLTVDDINDKLDRICAGTLSDVHRDRIRAAWWGIADAEDISVAMATMRTRP